MLVEILGVVLSFHILITSIILMQNAHFCVVSEIDVIIK
jgi:hypothetical protein